MEKGWGQNSSGGVVKGDGRGLEIPKSTLLLPKKRKCTGGHALAGVRDTVERVGEERIKNREWGVSN